MFLVAIFFIFLIIFIIVILTDFGGRVNLASAHKTAIDDPPVSGARGLSSDEEIKIVQKWQIRKERANTLIALSLVMLVYGLWLNSFYEKNNVDMPGMILSKWYTLGIIAIVLIISSIVSRKCPNCNKSLNLFFNLRTNASIKESSKAWNPEQCPSCHVKLRTPSSPLDKANKFYLVIQILCVLGIFVYVNESIKLGSIAFESDRDLTTQEPFFFWAVTLTWIGAGVYYLYCLLRKF